MKKPAVDQDFEAFRRQRSKKVVGGPAVEGAHAAPGKEHVWEALEAQESQEQQQMQLTQEVDDFFVDATKLAANIVQKVAESREQQIDGKLRTEMEDFLLQTIRRATNFIHDLGRSDTSDLGEASVEASLKNLVGAELDGFRAEGTAQLADKHLGQDPFATELIVDHEDQDEEEDLLGGDRIHLSDGELAVEFGSEDTAPEFAADEFATADVGQTPAIDADAPRPAQAAGTDEDDAPLAELYAQPLEDTEEGQDEIELEEAPYPEMPSQAEVENALRRQEQEQQQRLAEARKAADRKRVKQALSLLVRQGIMSKDEAREAYRRQIS